MLTSLGLGFWHMTLASRSQKLQRCTVFAFLLNHCFLAHSLVESYFHIYLVNLVSVSYIIWLKDDNSITLTEKLWKSYYKWSILDNVINISWFSVIICRSPVLWIWSCVLVLSTRVTWITMAFLKSVVRALHLATDPCYVWFQMSCLNDEIHCSLLYIF